MRDMMIKMHNYHLNSLRWAAFYVVPLALFWTFTRLDPRIETAMLLGLAFAAHMVKPASPFTRNSTSRATIIYAALALVAVALYPPIYGMCSDVSWELWYLFSHLIDGFPAPIRSYLRYFPLIFSYSVSIFIASVICATSGFITTFFVVKSIQNVSRKES